MITNKSNNVKADVAIVKIGHLEIEGYLTSEGEFGLSLSDFARLIGIEPKQVRARILNSKYAKTLSDKGFPGSKKCKVDKNKGSIIQIIPVDWVISLIQISARIGIEGAWEILDLLAGLSLHQLFSDAFNLEFEKEERQKWLKARQEGKVVRRTLTDAIKDYINTHNCNSSYKQFIYANVTNEIYDGVFNRKAKTLKQQWECDNPRDVMTEVELSEIKQVEQLTMRIIDQDNLEPVRAVNEALERLIIPTITR
jgi:hypothetical protein